MIRIGFLGCDSSHTEAYSALMNPVGSPFHGKARIEWLWGADPAQVREKARACLIPNVCEKRKDAIVDADLVMVCNRFGEDHFESAYEAIVLGKPTYIDKPLTNDPAQARELLRLSRDRGVAVTSFSPLRLAPEMQQLLSKIQTLGPIHSLIATGPAFTTAIQDLRAKSFHFYAIHAADLLLAACPEPVWTVQGHQSRMGISGAALTRGGVHATLNLPLAIGEYYHLTVYGTKGTISVEIDPFGKFYEATVHELIHFLVKGDTGKVPFETAVQSVELLSSLQKSIQSGGAIDLQLEDRKVRV